MLSLIIAFSATPIAKKLAFKVGAVDIPKDSRRMHKRAIAKLGGMAMVSGFFITILFNLVISLIDKSSPLKPSYQLLGLLIGILIIVIMGLIDDLKGLSAKYKLIFQLAAAIVVVIFGTKIQIVTNPFSETGFALSPVIYYPLTIMWIVGITNAINFIDGLDGLAAGISSIAALSLFFVSVINGRWDAAILTAALAGATLGFLPYNFNPAKIFMADTGSNFLGFTLGVISIQGTLKSYAAIAIAIPLLVLGLPLFDTVFAILRRIVKGKSIMEADRGHLHHRLIDMGLSHKQSVVIMYIFSAALGLCAIVLADKGIFTAIILVILISAFIIGGVRYMSEINDDFEEDEVKAEEYKIENNTININESEIIEETISNNDIIIDTVDTKDLSDEEIIKEKSK
jgi:UDP-GlcNAc:undecaprenyl-phosphate/decaprenyl-phosphate GlcNAc-1-phosphate transferase